MIPSSRKVGKDLFETLMKKGQFYSSESFDARVVFDTVALPARFSVVVAKKLEKSAVIRNAYKRRAYSLLRPFLGRIKVGVVCVIFLKKRVVAKDLPALSLELERFMEKSKLFLTK